MRTHSGKNKSNLWKSHLQVCQPLLLGGIQYELLERKKLSDWTGLWQPGQSFVSAGSTLSLSCSALCRTGQITIDTGCDPALTAQLCWSSSRFWSQPAWICLIFAPINSNYLRGLLFVKTRSFKALDEVKFSIVHPNDSSFANCGFLSITNTIH